MSIETFDPNAANVTLTPEAIAHFSDKLSERDEPSLIRLSIRKSGCTGYAYVLDYVPEPAAGDVLVKASNDVTLAVAEQALQIVRGTEIDMVREGINYVVKFRNPNVVNECGCGESFDVG